VSRIKSWIKSRSRIRSKIESRIRSRKSGVSVLLLDCLEG